MIINQRLNPELFELLQNAKTNGTKYEDCYVTKCEEFTKGEDMYCVFTLREAENELPYLGA